MFPPTETGAEQREPIRPQQKPPNTPWLGMILFCLALVIVVSLVLRERCVSISDSRYWTPWSGCVNTDD